jgi:hypothetical protein
LRAEKISVPQNASVHPEKQGTNWNVHRHIKKTGGLETVRLFMN